LARRLGDRCLQGGREDGDERGTREPEGDAEEPAEQALQEGLAGYLADDEPLRPAESLQRSELADPLLQRAEARQPGTLAAERHAADDLHRRTEA
jgi:hypothetical protein